MIGSVSLCPGPLPRGGFDHSSFCIRHRVRILGRTESRRPNIGSEPNEAVPIRPNSPSGPGPDASPSRPIPERCSRGWLRALKRRGLHVLTGYRPQRPSLKPTPPSRCASAEKRGHNAALSPEIPEKYEREPPLAGLALPACVETTRQEPSSNRRGGPALDRRWSAREWPALPAIAGEIGRDSIA